MSAAEASTFIVLVRIGFAVSRNLSLPLNNEVSIFLDLLHTECLSLV